MTAPKIDTQAPTHICAYDDGLGAPDSRTWSDTYPIGKPYILASLSAAREAAAYRHGLNDGIDKAANRYRVCASPDVWDYFYTAHNAMLDLKTFEFPAPEGQAALDRLIAERVREAVEACAAKAADEARGVVEQMRQSAEQVCQIVMDQAKEYGIPQMALGAKACRDDIRDLKLDAARGSKEGRDG